MKKNEIYQGTVTELKSLERGVVCTPEGNVTVKGVLPGQTVSFILTKKRNGRFEGRLHEVLKKAPYEMESPCPHFGYCGGCAYQNLPYDKELKIKDSEVKKILDGAIRGGYIYEGIAASPEAEGYRNKMEFSFGNEYIDGPLTLGMHRKGCFNDVVTVDHCLIGDGDYRLVIKESLDFFRERNIPFFRKHTEKGFLRHLLMRKGKKTGEILILIETTTQISFDMREYSDMLLSLMEKGKLKGVIGGILHLRNDDPGDSVKGDDIEILYGRDHFYDEVLGLKFKVTPFSFFQTNTLGAELLYAKAREYALSVSGEGKNSVIFDLYSGTGTIGQLMSKAASRVVGIEIVPEAVLAARENAALNGLDNTEFLAGDVFKVLDGMDLSPDLIILDPPRDGCSPKALGRIMSYGVENIIYISCKITSLARDLQPLQEAGYRVVKASAVDMFPKTSGVETVVLLSQQRPDEHVNIKIDLDELDETSAEVKATYAEITEWVKKNYGFHVSNLNIAQIKRKHGIIERENYNFPKSEGSRQPGTTLEKEKAITEALKYFKMI